MSKSEREDLLLALLEAGDYELATELVAESEKPRKKKTRTTRRAALPRAPRKLTQSEQALENRRAALAVRKRKPTKKRKPSAPKAPGLSRAERDKLRLRHEAAKRGAVTRSKAHKRITSKTRRKTALRLEASPSGREVGFEFSDILAGRNPSNPEVREIYDAALNKHIGKDVQVTFYVTVNVEGEKYKKVRIRRIIRDFKGRIDIANLANSALREAMRQYGSERETFLNSVSVQAFDE